jgi:eukaryotic-like serine/threonine-protein kinase
MGGNDDRPGFSVNADVEATPVGSTLPSERPATISSPEASEQPARVAPIESGVIFAGKYRLDEPIGAGGMGQVFKGQHLLLHTPIAIKVLHAFVSSDARQERRLQREARAAVVLDHPNTVRVFDFGRHGDTPFIVMEYIQGVSLDNWLFGRGGLPPISEVASITLQLLAALEAAHALNIVHRDLKPENVLLTPGRDGAVVVKIVDFGLAHVEDPADLGPTLTQRDAIAGTPAYMSPEQCRSLAVGPSTDLYAVGCLLTTMLQGEPPFEGAAAMDVIAKQMFLPPPPLRRPPEAEPVPPLLERLRMDLLAKQAHARPKDAATTASRLREAVSPEAHAKRLPSRKGDIPLGSREERAIHPSAPPSHAPGPKPAKASLKVTVVKLASHPDGWNENHIAGLASQGISIVSVSSSVEPDAPRGDVTIIDAADNVAAAVSAMRTLKGGPAVVCVQHTGGDSMNQLIEAGASEVLRYPIATDKLAKRIRRASKRRR